MQAAVLSGISVNRYLIMVFVYAGFLSAVSSIVLTARIRSIMGVMKNGLDLMNVSVDFQQVLRAWALAAHQLWQ